MNKLFVKTIAVILSAILLAPAGEKNGAAVRCVQPRECLTPSINISALPDAFAGLYAGYSHQKNHATLSLVRKITPDFLDRFRGQYRTKIYEWREGVLSERNDGKRGLGWRSVLTEPRQFALIQSLTNGRRVYFALYHHLIIPAFGLEDRAAGGRLRDIVFMNFDHRYHNDYADMASWINDDRSLTEFSAKVETDSIAYTAHEGNFITWLAFRYGLQKLLRPVITPDFFYRQQMVYIKREYDVESNRNGLLIRALEEENAFDGFPKEISGFRRAFSETIFSLRMAKEIIKELPKDNLVHSFDADCLRDASAADYQKVIEEIFTVDALFYFIAFSPQYWSREMSDNHKEIEQLIDWAIILATQDKVRPEVNRDFSDTSALIEQAI